MRIALSEVKVLLVHVNPRSELHGEERQPAADIKFRATMPNKVLDQFHGTLKHALFYHDVANPANDLADKAMEGNPDHLPHRRFPSLQSPLSWAEGMEGGKLTVHHGVGGRSDIVVADIKVNNFKLHPKDGGSVEIEFRVQSHPDEKVLGKLYTLMQTEVTISIEPPKAEDEAQAPIPGTTADLATA